ncbi:MAG: lysylphosphatidylglycerol synthase transmembrane domain-containing protein [Anaerolineae bacterium]
MRRRWIVLLLAAAFVALAIYRYNDVLEFWRTVRSGRWEWVLAALALQAIYYIFYAGIYQSAFLAVGVSIPLVKLLPVMLGSVFINTIAPSLGASGAALFVNDATRRGQSPAAAAAGTVLVPVIDMTTLNLMLIVGLAQLAWEGKTTGFEIASAIILVVLNLTLVLLLVAGVRRPQFSRRLLRLFEQLANAVSQRLRRRPALPDGWSYTYSEEFVSAARAVSSQGRRLWRGLAVAMVANVAELGSLWCLFLGFREPLTYGILVAGYTIGNVVQLVQFTPQGVGVVEGAMAFTYASLGASAAGATAAILVFRGLNVGLPALLGFFILQHRGLFGRHRHPQ